MLQWLTNWRDRIRARRAAHELAWLHATEMGNDRLTDFQRMAIASLEPITGPLKLETRAFEDRPSEAYLLGNIPNTNSVLYLYEDGAGIHGAKRAEFIAEKWDYDSPEALCKELVTFVRSLNAA